MDLVVTEFPGSTTPGDSVVTRLEERFPEGAIRVAGFALVAKDAQGNLSYPVPDWDRGLISGLDLYEIGTEISLGYTAAVILLEHCWAEEMGEIVFTERIPATVAEVGGQGLLDLAARVSEAIATTPGRRQRHAAEPRAAHQAAKEQARELSTARLRLAALDQLAQDQLTPSVAAGSASDLAGQQGSGTRDHHDVKDHLHAEQPARHLSLCRDVTEADRK